MFQELENTMKSRLLAALLLLAGLGHALADEAARNVIFVFDASGSMWAEMEGGHRIPVAREVMREVVGDLGESTNVALVAYGHNRRGDCEELGVTVNQQPWDARVRIVDTANQQDMIRDFGTSMLSGSNNPRSYSLPAGVYDVEFTGSNILGGPAWMRDIEVGAGQQLEQIHDFQLGTLKLGLTQSGRPLSGAVNIINQANGQRMIKNFGTSRIGNPNPRSYELPAGIYDVEFTASGIQAEPARRRGIQVEVGKTIEQIVDFD